MADIGMLLTIAQTLFATLQCSELKEIWYLWKYKSDLEALEETVSTIRNVLLDAEANEELSNEAHEWIEKLRDALYDADDIFDEFVSLIEKKQSKEGIDLSEKVHDFFSFRNRLFVAYKMTQKIKHIRKKLDDITNNHSKYGLTFGRQPVRYRRQETGSYVHAGDVIGREDDVKAIMDMLLIFDEEDVGFVAIVGMGGLGKTTLAQVVYNNEKVRTEFPLRMWVCVSDQDQKQFDLKAILCKILESVTGGKHDSFSMDWVQNQLYEKIKGNKFLLILDDVWNEERHEWDKLRSFFRGCQRESWIVVTTRSIRTAKAIRKGHIYELEGLSEENSWHLFEMTSFDKHNKHANSDIFIEAGKRIVEKCANVPLAIKVVGSFLYGLDEVEWLSFQEKGLVKIRKDNNEIISILKISYHNLESSIKSCFTYCALFPKDLVINKDLLISLWIAQGYIRPFDEGQSIEDAAEECFSILLRRCFFQDVEINGYGEIISCKIHDLMHDVALDVAGKEFCVVNSTISNLDKDARHVFHAGRNYGEDSITKTKIRSYLQSGWSSSLPVGMLVAKWSLLRSLDMHNSTVKSLPISIGDLLHLRCLNLSYNHYLETLPHSFTKLLNLQSLYLKDCFSLKELPRSLCRLGKLRLLDILGCKGLSHMPINMDKLNCLSVLTSFLVAEGNSIGKQTVGQLVDLRALTNIKGHLSIWIDSDLEFSKKQDTEEGYLSGMEHLKSIRICWKENKTAQRIDDEEALLENLQPHPNLRELMLIGYSGSKIPRWGIECMEPFLPNLVKIVLKNCTGLHSIPSMSKLRHLKFIELRHLLNLEYIDNLGASSSCTKPLTSQSRAAEFWFFPSLEEVILWDMPKLRGWWRMDGLSRDQLLGSIRRGLPSFSCLSKLIVGRCPNFMSIPLCPTLRSMCLYWFNRTIPTISTNLDSSSEMVNLFKSFSSSLLSLTVGYQFQNLSGALKHLTALESLEIHNTPNLTFAGALDHDMPWRSFQQSLRFLSFFHLPQLMRLPQGMQHLTSLRILKIQFCERLEKLPEWIMCLASLQSLYLIGCDKLESLPSEMCNLISLRLLEISSCSAGLRERCHCPNGEDWPKIQHIPSISID